MHMKISHEPPVKFLRYVSFGQFPYTSEHRTTICFGLLSGHLDFIEFLPIAAESSTQPTTSNDTPTAHCIERSSFHQVTDENVIENLDAITLFLVIELKSNLLFSNQLVMCASMVLVIITAIHRTLCVDIQTYWRDPLLCTCHLLTQSIGPRGDIRGGKKGIINK